MTTNDEVINKMKHSKLTIAQQLPIMLNKARGEGYKEGQKDTAKYIFDRLELSAYILKPPPDVATRTENVAIDLSQDEFKAIKKEFKVD